MNAVLKKLLLLLFLVLPGLASTPKPVLSTTHQVSMKTIFDHKTCSGTAIGPHALLTASHCELGTDLVVIDGEGYTISKRIRDERDHSIFIVPEVTFENVAEFSAADLEKGSDVWICGNPAGAPLFVRHGILAGQANGMRWYDIHGFYGDSGAAVFDENGKIVDVISDLHTEVQDDLPFILMGTIPLGFTPEQIKEAEAK